MDELLIQLIKMMVILFGFLGVVAYSTLAERKISARFQLRIGPNRTGPFGVFQPIADAVKFIFKEDFMPEAAKPWLFKIAPVLSVVPTFMILAVIPFGGHPLMQIADINVAFLFILGLTSMGVYGVILGGWSSGNKYSLRGALRASAQMISYEIPMGLTLVAIIMLMGTFSLKEMVQFQTEHAWNIVMQPLGFFLFFVATLAEIARVPFDLPEAENELVGGYHTEYSGFRFAMFQTVEFSHMVLASLILSTLFLGGFSFPGMGLISSELLLSILQLGSLLLKTFFFIFVFMWIRWTLPRFRYDQLMNLGWRVMIPLALFNVVLTGFLGLLHG
jgi:NADH-quinone oxidoreductase subunit H